METTNAFLYKANDTDMKTISNKLSTLIKEGGESRSQDSYMAVLEASLQHKPLKDFEQDR